jgi:pimeloyl-ACP methyl ester carboxylesterase
MDDLTAVVRELAFTVALEPGGPRELTVAASLCAPSGWLARPVQVLLHGGTCNRWYWDPSYRPEEYCYVRAAAARGLATLNVGRLGQGASPVPSAGELTHGRHGHAVRQMLAAVGDGVLGEVPSSLVLAGHSMGSAVALDAADDTVAGVPVTGFAHRHGDDAAVRAVALNWPAAGDPGLPPGRYGEGYLTSRPGARAEPFYSVSDTDPEMIAEDERHKGTLAAVELAGCHESRLRVLDLKAPLMYVAGTADPLSGPFAGRDDLIAVERSFAPESESLDGLLVEGMHHSLNLHRGASAWFSQALDWVEARAEGYGTVLLVQLRNYSLYYGGLDGSARYRFRNPLHRR